MAIIRILGLDPGLQRTGWGIVDAEGLRLKHVAHGTVTSTSAFDLSDRLKELHDGLAAVIAEWKPDEAAVEETFVNKNPVSTLKLGQARGVALLVPALNGLPVAEYAPNHVKKAVVGAGHAGKEQIQAMVHMLFPGVAFKGADAMDALAVAVAHAHNAGARRNLAAMMKGQR